MSEITVNLGVVSIPENRIWRIICCIPRRLTGTQKIEFKIDNLLQHVRAMTDIVHILVADISGEWTAEKRERVQKMMGDFTIVNKGLESVNVKGNPFTQQELDTLRSYTRQAQDGRTFTLQQAVEFRQLSERASVDFVGQEWVTELLKIALFVFALYAISRILSRE